MTTKAFFNHVRVAIAGGRLGQAQVDGINAIVSAWRRLGRSDDLRQLAYGLGTAFHETAGRCAPVRETLAVSDAEAVARLEAAFAAGRLPQVSAPYWRADEEGCCWFGRGFVQLTFRQNYERMGAVLGIDLVARPELALRADVAADILVVGMRDGLFSGRRLCEFFDGDRADWVGARRIVNGLDRAERVAELARLFWDGLR
ncbi:glycoside hydrolase family 19 protein [Rhizobium paknamense]|uniref:Chitinase n=1 Tax=Rhizobium paknamense TaxID=1206817 RepID=A0ABU0I7U4_9HYPH|nr:glycoside hydrolase family 19 protein [Rhizobium paknamense]MDQ0454292.1 putative chitinase [Rhizobium paknamense]